MRNNTNSVWNIWKRVSCSGVNALACFQKAKVRYGLLQSRIISCFTHKIGLMGRQWQLYSLHMSMLPTRPWQNLRKSHSPLSSSLQTVITPSKASQRVLYQKQTLSFAVQQLVPHLFCIDKSCAFWRIKALVAVKQNLHYYETFSYIWIGVEPERK